MSSQAPACDLTALRVRDICQGSRVATSAIVLQRKTQRLVQFAITVSASKATLIYRRTKNLRAVQLLLGHSRIESTCRYLGIEVDDALELPEQTGE